jgi:hypothetical protein
MFKILPKEKSTPFSMNTRGKPEIHPPAALRINAYVVQNLALSKVRDLGAWILEGDSQCTVLRSISRVPGGQRVLPGCH